MQCDICSSPGMGTVVPAKQMSNAVRKGFNPFTLGLMPDEVARRAQATGYPERWAQSAISGDLSVSDWNVCSTCMRTLTRYMNESNTLGCGASPSVGSAKPRPLSPPSPVAEVSVNPVSFASAEPAVPAITSRSALDEDAFKRSFQRIIKGVIALVALSVLKVIINSLLREHVNFGGMSLNEWVAVIISLFMVGFVVTLYWPATTVVTHYLALFAKKGIVPGGERHVDSLRAVGNKGTLLVFLLSLYWCSLPVINQCNSAFLNFRNLNTVLNVTVLVAVVGVLFLIWKDLSPIIDFLTGHITDRVSSLSSDTRPADASVNVPSGECDAAGSRSCGGGVIPAATVEQKSQSTCAKCAAENPPASKFCYQCGSLL